MHLYAEWIGENIGAKIPERERRWQLAEESAVYGVNDETLFQGCPLTPET
jgi:hypothetical protein